MPKSNLVRLLNNVRKSSIETSKIFQSIDNTYPEYQLGANTPIPNQVFAPALDYSGSPATLYLLKNCNKKIDAIRKLMQYHDSNRESTGKVPRPIEFIALGYKDYDDNYIITKIECPLLEDTLDSKHKTMSYILPYSGEYSERIEEAYFSHLNKKFDKKIAKCPVALLGFTRPTQYAENQDIQNCFKLSEISRSIYPNEQIDTPIVTGVLGITPYTIERIASRDKSKAQYKYIDGSLECALIDYALNPNTSCPRPTDIKNVLKCEIIHDYEDTKTTSIAISQSRQPKTGLYCTNNAKYM